MFDFVRGLRSVGAGLAVICLISACSSDGGEGPPIIAQPDRPVVETPPPTREEERDRYDRRGFVKPPHMQSENPVRVALLLPFTANSETAQKIASAMFDAAQLAAFDAGDEQFLLIPKDTKGTAEGAAGAARSALSDGAEILLGPLFAESVDAAAQVARAAGAPLIGFSSDVSAAGDGVYLLSFPPEVEIKRVTDFAIAQDMTRFGVIAPQTEYGDRVSTSFSNEVFSRGGVVVHEERYQQDPDAMLAPAKRLARYSRDVIPNEMRHDYDPDAPQTSDSGYTRGYQAVLMPEQGTLLRALAPLLPYYNVNINRVKLLGVSAWNNASLTREPALRGGWFAAPDPSITKSFKDRYSSAFGANPPRLASLAYDATLLAARLASNSSRRGRFDDRAITDPNGYFGADGLFRLNSDGSIERGLAILEIQPGGIRVVDPAPRSFVAGF